MLAEVLDDKSTRSWESIRSEILNAIAQVRDSRSLEESAESTDHTDEEKQNEKMKNPKKTQGIESGQLEKKIKKTIKKRASGLPKKTRKEDMEKPLHLRDKFLDGSYSMGYIFDPSAGELFMYTPRFGKSYYQGSEELGEKKPKVYYAQEGSTLSYQEVDKQVHRMVWESITGLNKYHAGVKPIWMGTAEDQLFAMINMINPLNRLWNRIKYTMALK